MTHKRLPQLDYMRIFAMCAVVLVHTLSSPLPDFTPVQSTVYNILFSLLQFAVPIFVMLSGALVLPRDWSYGEIFRRCRRFLLALVIFGLPAAVLENVFNAGGFRMAALWESCAAVLAGKSWDVFWFLYMLVGLYLTLPVLQMAAKHDPKRLYQLGLILFVLAAVVPAVNGLAGKTVIAFQLPDFLVWWLYAIVGSGIVNGLTDGQRKNLLWPAAIYLLLYTAAVIVNFCMGWGLGELLISTPLVFLQSCSLFLVIFCAAERPSKLMQLLSPLSFGVYLVHCYFINFTYKFLHITPWDYPLWISIPAAFLLFLVLSLLTVSLLRKIPFAKKYVL